MQALRENAGGTGAAAAEDRGVAARAEEPGGSDGDESIRCLLASTNVSLAISDLEWLFDLDVHGIQDRVSAFGLGCRWQTNLNQLKSYLLKTSSSTSLRRFNKKLEQGSTELGTMRSNISETELQIP